MRKRANARERGEEAVPLEQERPADLHCSRRRCSSITAAGRARICAVCFTMWGRDRPPPLCMRMPCKRDPKRAIATSMRTTVVQDHRQAARGNSAAARSSPCSWQQCVAVDSTQRSVRGVFNAIEHFVHLQFTLLVETTTESQSRP